MPTLSEYVEYLLVALLPEDAAALRAIEFITQSTDQYSMSSLNLTESQQMMLQTVVDLYREEGDESAIKAERIAEVVARTPGTIRNQMQSLKALHVVEGIPGPRGGYKPTATAYQALDIQTLEDAAEVPFAYEGESMPEVLVTDITLTSVHHPELCRAEIRLQGGVTDYSPGDVVTVGPTPLSEFWIAGTIEGIDTTDNCLVLTVEELRAPASNGSDL